MSEPLSAAELEEAREFGAYERDTFPRLLATVEAKDAAIARLRRALESLVAECDKSMRWRDTRGMRTATDKSAFASTSYSGVLEIRRALQAALEKGGPPLSAEEMEELRAQRRHTEDRHE